MSFDDESKMVLNASINEVLLVHETIVKRGYDEVSSAVLAQTVVDSIGMRALILQLKEMAKELNVTVRGNNA